MDAFLEDFRGTARLGGDVDLMAGFFGEGVGDVNGPVDLLVHDYRGVVELPSHPPQTGMGFPEVVPDRSQFVVRPQRNGLPQVARRYLLAEHGDPFHRPVNVLSKE